MTLIDVADRMAEMQAEIERLRATLEATTEALRWEVHKNRNSALAQEVVDLRDQVNKNADIIRGLRTELKATRRVARARTDQSVTDLLADLKCVTRRAEALEKELARVDRPSRGGHTVSMAQHDELRARYAEVCAQRDQQVRIIRQLQNRR